MLNQVEKTDAAGNTEGMAEELSTQVDSMRANTSAVLSGIVKLDECVDKKEKVVMVQVGWKPSLSKAAADAVTTINKEVQRGQRSAATSTARGTVKAAQRVRNLGPRATANNKDGGASPRKSGASGLPGLRIIVVKVEGIGANIKRATNEALRSAVSQVFGEQFAAKTKTVDLTNTAELSGSLGNAAIAVERSSTKETISSKTKGLIKSYRYLKKQKHDEGIRVFLEVKLPKYKSGLDPSKSKIIVLRPKLSASIKTKGSDMKVFIAALQDSLEANINLSRNLTVLDRRFVKDQLTELKNIASGNSPIEELAKLGNRAGADLMMVSEIISYTHIKEQTRLGSKTIDRSLFNSEVAIKVIDIASSNIMYSQRVPFRKQRIRSSNPASKFGAKIGVRLSKRITNKLGGGIARSSESPNMDRAIKRVNRTFNKAKEDAKNDW